MLPLSCVVVFVQFVQCRINPTMKSETWLREVLEHNKLINCSAQDECLWGEKSWAIHKNSLLFMTVYWLKCFWGKGFQLVNFTFSFSPLSPPPLAPTILPPPLYKSHLMWLKKKWKSFWVKVKYNTLSTNISYLSYISLFLGGWIVHYLGIFFAWQSWLIFSIQHSTNKLL